MRRKPLLALGAGALLVLAACDSRDYEAEIADLETQLQEAEGQLQQAMSENETLSGQMTEMEAGGGEVSEGAAQAIGEIQMMAQRTYDRLGALEREPDAPADQMEEAIAALREDVQGILDSVQTAGQELGVELEQAATEGGEAAGGAAQEAEGAAQDAGEAVEGAAEEAGQAAEEAGEEVEEETTPQ